MSTSTVLRAAALASATIAIVLPAAAAPPFERIEIDEVESFDFPLCAIPTSVDVVETGTLTIRPKGADGLAHYSLDVTGMVVNTNIATGRSVRLERHLLERDVRVVAGEGDLLTIRGHSVVHETDYNSDGSVAFRSYGRQPWTLVVDSKGTETGDDDEVVIGGLRSRGRPQRPCGGRLLRVVRRADRLTTERVLRRVLRRRWVPCAPPCWTASRPSGRPSPSPRSSRCS